MRVLVVEDDDNLAGNMRLMLTGENWIVHRCRTGERAIAYAKSLTLDVVTLDMGLPDMDGLAVLRALPERTKRPPIIVVSGLETVEMRVAALRAGAADYIIKPFHRDELLARIHAVTRRYDWRAEDVVEIGEWRIDVAGQFVSFDGVEVLLPRVLRSLLMKLATRPGWIFSNEDLLSSVWPIGEEPDAHAVSVYICKLRQKLSQASGGDNLIECVWHRGYALNPSPTLYRTGKKPAADDGRDWFTRLGLDAGSVAETVA